MIATREVGKTYTDTRGMAEYRIVKWSPEQPETKQPATEAVYTDLAFAERIKTTLEMVLPHRCFAVEAINQTP